MRSVTRRWLDRQPVPQHEMAAASVGSDVACKGQGGQPPLVSVAAAAATPVVGLLSMHADRFASPPSRAIGRVYGVPVACSSQQTDRNRRRRQRNEQTDAVDSRSDSQEPSGHKPRSRGGVQVPLPHHAHCLSLCSEAVLLAFARCVSGSAWPHGLHRPCGACAVRLAHSDRVGRLLACSSVVVATPGCRSWPCAVLSRMTHQHDRGVVLPNSVAF